MASCGLLCLWLRAFCVLVIFVVWLCVNSVGHDIIVYCMYGYEFSVFLVYLLVDVL